jgi:hypothetical protein
VLRDARVEHLLCRTLEANNNRVNSMCFFQLTLISNADWKCCDLRLY